MRRSGYIFGVAPTLRFNSARAPAENGAALTDNPAWNSRVSALRYNRASLMRQKNGSNETKM